MTGTSSAPLLIGIDIGTSSTKGVLTDATGAVLRVETRSHSTLHPNAGYSEHDPEATWWFPVVSLLQELATNHTDRISGICISGLGPCAVVGDEDGTALRPAILYGIDTRNTTQIERMKMALSVDDPRGGRLTTQSVGPKLLWIRDEEPEIWGKTRRVFTSHTFVSFHLTGAYTIDRLSASWWDPLVEGAGTAWRQDEVNRWFPGLALPRIVEANDVVGRLTAEASSLTGLPIGLPVYSGTTDYAAQVLGTGANEPGQCVVIFGSTLSVNLITSDSDVAPGISSSPGPIRGTWFSGGVTAASGALLQWVRDIMGNLTHEELAEQAAAVSPGCGGIIMLPYMAGERSPLDDPCLRGVIAGLDLSHGTGHVYRAAYEAIGFSLRHILDSLGDRRPGSLIATGGGAANDLLMQIVADISKVDVTVVNQSHTAAVGSCVLAGANARHQGLGPQEVFFSPSTPATKIYDDAYEIYRQLGTSMTPLLHELASMSGSTEGLTK